MRAAAGAALVLLAAVAAVAAVPCAEAVSRVQVDLFVMSKCPDAVFAEAAISPVLRDLSRLVAVALHFIGVRDADSGAWGSKHGPSEVAGDIQELCVQEHTKAYDSYSKTFRFAECANNEGLDAVGTLPTAVKCLRDVGAPLAQATKVLGCVYGPGHQELLERDFAQTEALGVKTSATIRVDGETAAVRDGGRWVGDGGFTAAGFKERLCAAYAAKNRGRLPRECKVAAAR